MGQILMQVEHKNVSSYPQSFINLSNVLLPFWHISVWLCINISTHHTMWLPDYVSVY